MNGRISSYESINFTGMSTELQSNTNSSMMDDLPVSEKSVLKRLLLSTTPGLPTKFTEVVPKQTRLVADKIKVSVIAAVESQPSPMDVSTPTVSETTPLGTDESSDCRDIVVKKSIFTKADTFTISRGSMPKMSIHSTDGESGSSGRPQKLNLDEICASVARSEAVYSIDTFVPAVPGHKVVNQPSAAAASSLTAPEHTVPSVTLQATELRLMCTDFLDFLRKTKHDMDMMEKRLNEIFSEIDKTMNHSRKIYQRIHLVPTNVPDTETEIRVQNDKLKYLIGTSATTLGKVDQWLLQHKNELLHYISLTEYNNSEVDIRLDQIMNAICSKEITFNQ